MAKVPAFQENLHKAIQALSLKFPLKNKQTEAHPYKNSLLLTTDLPLVYY